MQPKKHLTPALFKHMLRGVPARMKRTLIESREIKRQKEVEGEREKGREREREKVREEREERVRSTE